jgi:lipopolysaccharide/colanic/teichoic acid biosynthesis glycosyltransferase
VTTDMISLPLGECDSDTRAANEIATSIVGDYGHLKIATLFRLRDAILASALLVFFAPLILLFAGIIFCTSKGPVFIKSERIGLGGKPFAMYKLRSMQVDAAAVLDSYLAAHPELASEWFSTFKLKKDPRIIPWIGSFIRKSSIDELPQLLNVLRGEMSIVGPRPFPAYHLAAFDKSFQITRATVRPGLTGPWQVRSRNSGGLDSQIYWDGKYIRERSFLTDLKILWQTVWVVITARNVS